MNQTGENGKIPNFGHKTLIPILKIFLRALPLLVVRNCSKLLSYAISRKTNETNFRKWQNT